MRFLRILHWRARAKFYRLKAEKLERTVSMLRRELNAEMERNREREDVFVSATVMGGRQMYGIPPRVGPALQAAAPTPTQSPLDPWQHLSWPDKAEFETNWWPLAQERGRSLIQARQDFMVELANRRQLNDEPFNVN
jgi:hypothetical protein